MNEVAGELGEGGVDPPALMPDVEQLHHASDHLAIRHVLKVDGLTCFVASKPDFLEVVVELLDNVLPVLLELGNALVLGKAEDLLIHLGPEAHTPRGELEDGLAQLGADRDHTTGGFLVRLLPVAVIQALGVDDGLLSALAGVCFLDHHHPATEQASVEGHRRVSVLLRPLSRDIWVRVLGASETAAGDEDDVLGPADATVHLQDGLVEILERVMATAAAAGPLQDHGERGVRLGNVDNSLDRIHRAGLERDVLQAERLDVLLGHLDRGNASSDGEAFDGHALGSQASDQRNLPAHRVWFHVDEIESDDSSGRDSLLDLQQGFRHGLGVVVAATSQLDVIAGIHGRRHKVPRHGRRGHAGHHDGWHAEQSAHLGVHIRVAAGRLDEPRAELAHPIDGVLDGALLIAVEELRLVANLGNGAADRPSQDHSDTRTILVTAGQDAEPRDATGTEVQDMRGLGEYRGTLPVDGVPRDQPNQGRDDVAVNLIPDIPTGGGVEYWETQALGAEINMLQVLIDQGRRLGEVLAVERGRDGQEAVDEANFPLGVGYPSLVQAGGRLDLAQLKVQAVQGDGWARDVEVARAVDERDGDVAIGREILVRGIDVLLDLGLGEISDAQHGRRHAFAVVDRVLQHGRRHGRSRERLLATRTNPEEDGQCQLSHLAEPLPRIGGRRHRGQDDALRVTGGTADPLAEDAGMDAEDPTGDSIVRQLDQADQGEADRGGDEIVDIGGSLGVSKPGHDIQPLGKELHRARVLGQALEQLCRRGDEVADKVGILLEELPELLEVLLDVALAPEDAVQARYAFVGSTEEGRLMGPDSLVRDGEGGIVAPDDLGRLGIDAWKRSRQGVHRGGARGGARGRGRGGRGGARGGARRV